MIQNDTKKKKNIRNATYDTTSSSININSCHDSIIKVPNEYIVPLCDGALAVHDELLFQPIRTKQVLSESATPVPIPSLHIATTTQGAYRLLMKAQHNNHPMNNSTLTKNNNNNTTTTTTTTTTRMKNNQQRIKSVATT